MTPERKTGKKRLSFGSRGDATCYRSEEFLGKRGEKHISPGDVMERKSNTQLSNPEGGFSDRDKKNLKGEGRRDTKQIQVVAKARKTRCGSFGLIQEGE